MLRRVVPRVFSATASMTMAVRRTSIDNYTSRHIGPSVEETQTMLQAVGFASVADLMASVLPKDIVRAPMPETAALSEKEALAHFRGIMSKNKVLKSLIGQGYYEAITPPAILRNVLENPAWYTPYTPYQPEIAQGRLESLLNFQTLVTDLTKMDIANASLLDQATAAGEALYMAVQAHKGKRKKVFVADNVFASSIGMVKTRAEPMGLEIVVGPLASAPLSDPQLAGIIVQTPDAQGLLHDFSALFAEAKKNGVITIAGTDLLALTLLKPTGEMGADITYGSAQRFGIPLGYGGPHAAFFAVRDDLKRSMPGRLIGVSKDAQGNKAIRMALQTREQHIRREKATSNICTAQALLSNMNAFYAIYHGPDGLKEVASEVHAKAKTLAVGLESVGHRIANASFFDTLTVQLGNGLTAQQFSQKCVERGINIFTNTQTGTVSIAIDEATSTQHITSLLEAAGLQHAEYSSLAQIAQKREAVPADLLRTSTYLQSEVFKAYRCESSLMRYIWRLVRKDFGLTHGMIALGSCTMKLNAAATMIPMSWAEVNALHPLAPADQTKGYNAMLLDLEQRLKEVTGLAAVSLQPNSGAQGEYAGLRTIEAYHKSRGETNRVVCLIPQSAHGTNPASAVLAGMKIVTVKCDAAGRIDFADLTKACEANSANLSAIMVTYPSTYGVFDSDIKKITDLVHQHGGQVYIDGANFNAMVGYTGPGFFGGDVCHINMHKTFSIPHGGGGPGMGPIAVREHLAPFLPNAVAGPKVGGAQSFGQVSQAPYGSASILSISYMLMLMLGSTGLTKCTAMAILNANYLRKRLEPHYPILFLGDTGLSAHEFIIDLRPLKKSANIEAEDVAKRLMDYGFHAPTLAFPVGGTLMIEPTESEPLAELDRLADALISIRAEIKEVEEGRMPTEGNVLKHAPHTAAVVSASTWDRPYSREVAAYPSAFTRLEKFWPTVSRIDGAYGDRNLMCSTAFCEIDDTLKA